MCASGIEKSERTGPIFSEPCNKKFGVGFPEKFVGFPEKFGVVMARSVLICKSSQVKSSSNFNGGRARRLWGARRRERCGE